jgi:SAM-dependent methyltransferase
MACASQGLDTVGVLIDLRPWQELDAAPGADRLLAFLDHIATDREVAAIKRRSFELLEPSAGDTLLDAGCGTGRDALRLLELVRPGGHVVGIDTSSKVLAAARARAHGARGLRLHRSDLTSLPFADASFDGARADRVLLHVERPERAVAELVRVTRPGRRIVLSELMFSQPGVDASGAAPTGRQRLVEFLPFLLAQAGGQDLGVEASTASIDPGDEVREVLRAGPGAITVHAVHVYARAAPL